MWKKLVKERIASNAGKAVLLQWGQRVLAAGIAATALNIVMLVLVPLVLPVPTGQKEVKSMNPSKRKLKAAMAPQKPAAQTASPEEVKTGSTPNILNDPNSRVLSNDSPIRELLEDRKKLP